MNVMDLPSDMYLEIMNLVDNLPTIKSLRAVNKSALNASKQYFDNVLQQNIYLTYNTEWWEVHLPDTTQQQLVVIVRCTS